MVGNSSYFHEQPFMFFSLNYFPYTDNDSDDDDDDDHGQN